MPKKGRSFYGRTLEYSYEYHSFHTAAHCNCIGILYFHQKTPLVGTSGIYTLFYPYLHIPYARHFDSVRIPANLLVHQYAVTSYDRCSLNHNGFCHNLCNKKITTTAARKITCHETFSSKNA